MAFAKTRLEVKNELLFFPNRLGLNKTYTTGHPHKKKQQQTNKQKIIGRVLLLYKILAILENVSISRTFELKFYIRMEWVGGLRKVAGSDGRTDHYIPPHTLLVGIKI